MFVSMVNGGKTTILVTYPVSLNGCKPIDFLPGITYRFYSMLYAYEHWRLSHFSAKELPGSVPILVRFEHPIQGLLAPGGGYSAYPAQPFYALADVRA
jgi:hypothetical protein